MHLSTNLSIRILDLSTNISIRIFGYLCEYKHQDLGNLDESILWKIKRIFPHEGIHISSHPNETGSWYNVMVEWRTGDNITESFTIIIGGDTLKCDLYADDGQKKWE